MAVRINGAARGGDVLQKAQDIHADCGAFHECRLRHAGDAGNPVRRDAAGY